MLTIDNTVLVIIDAQLRLMNVMPDRDPICSSLGRLAQAAELLGLPTIITEQIPQKLGRTVPQITPPTGTAIIAKTSFSCCGEAAFMAELNELAPTAVVLAGIETHVCVYQTACDLLAAGLEVQIVADAVGSRSPANRDLAFRRLTAEGARLTNVEMLLFELMADANHPSFTDVLTLIK